MKESVITLEHVKRTYIMGETEVNALRDISFDIKQAGPPCGGPP